MQHIDSSQIFFHRYVTDPSRSRVSETTVRPAGEHTRIRIQTYHSDGTPKRIGGDAIRVTFRGITTVAANVWDLGNGKYDAMVLLMNPGLYLVDITLDYTMCAGVRDPPMEWFVNGGYLRVYHLVHKVQLLLQLYMYLHIAITIQKNKPKTPGELSGRVAKA